MNILGNDVSFKLHFGVYGDKGDMFSAGFTININGLDIISELMGLIMNIHMNIKM